MNERIRLLVKQAGIAMIPNSHPISITGLTTDLEKFAELIVKECAQVCRDQPNVYALKADRDNCAIAIEQHFGVEE